MASVREIARRAGVSITTVSRVLNNHPSVSEAARDSVLTAANAARYIAPVGRRSTTSIAYAYAGAMTLNSVFDGALMAGLSSGLEEFGYDLLILDLPHSRQAGETFTQLFMRKAAPGVILRTTAASRHVAEAIAAEGFPAIVVAEQFDNPAISFIYSASRSASREATEHLIGLGHSRIAFCTHVVTDHDHTDRLDGYKDALAAANIPFNSHLVFRLPASREGGAQAIRRVVTSPEKPTAAFIVDPVIAVGALSEARKIGCRVPEDLSIVGFDDADVRFSTAPEMTAICQDTQALGREAIGALFMLIENPGSVAPVRKALRTWLEIHGSTGPVPRAGTPQPRRRPSRANVQNRQPPEAPAADR